MTDRVTEDIFWYARMQLRKERYVSVRIPDPVKMRNVRQNLYNRSTRRGWGWNFVVVGDELIIHRENHVRG